MRIVHVVRQFSPAVGGLENTVQALAAQQRRQGIDAQVLTLDRLFHQPEQPLPAHTQIEGIPVHRVPYFGSYKYPIALSTLRHLKAYDLIHVHGLDFFADYLALTRHLHRTPLVISTHGGFFHTDFASKAKRLFFTSITRRSLKAYHQVFACSINDLELFRTIAPNQTTLIDNGVDLNKFANAGNNQFAFNFVALGRFADNKRLDRVILLMAELVKLTPRCRLQIIGRDWDHNQNRLTELIDQHELTEQVEIFTELSDQQIKQRLSQASFIISASQYEGFGLTLVEGMSAGLIPIASAIPSFNRILAKAQLGLTLDFTVPKQAAAELYQYGQRLRSDYSSVRQQAMQAAQRYAWPQTAALFSQHYRQILAGKRTLQGVALSADHADQIISQFDHAVAQQRPLNVAFANAHTINQAQQDPHFKQLLTQFLVLNDGVGVELASRWRYGRGFTQNLNGTDFIPRYLAQSQHSLRIFLFGAQAATVQRCFQIWQQRYPQHIWIGYQDGFTQPQDYPALCRRIATAQTDLLLVAMGNPKQEQWIAEHAKACGTPLAIGVGALFDFTAGVVPRAPAWVQRWRCEWIYRLLQEPKRLWRRYLLGNLRFLYHCLGDQT